MGTFPSCATFIPPLKRYDRSILTLMALRRPPGTCLSRILWKRLESFWWLASEVSCVSLDSLGHLLGGLLQPDKSFGVPTGLSWALLGSWISTPAPRGAIRRTSSRSMGIYTSRRIHLLQAGSFSGQEVSGKMRRWCRWSTGESTRAGRRLTRRTSR